MPIIQLLGIPAGLTDSDELTDLIINRIPAAIASVPELNLTPDQVSVFIPVGLMTLDCGTEIIALVTGLFAKPERTPEVKQQMAEELCEVLHEFAQYHVPHCRLIEVIPNSYNPEVEGYTKWLNEN